MKSKQNQFLCIQKVYGESEHFIIQIISNRYPTSKNSIEQFQ